MTETWRDEAACLDSDPDLFESVHGRGPNDKIVKRVVALFCDRCPVRTPCLKTALEMRASGIWGGVYLTGRSTTRRLDIPA